MRVTKTWYCPAWRRRRGSGQSIMRTSIRVRTWLKGKKLQLHLCTLDCSQHACQKLVFAVPRRLKRIQAQPILLCCMLRFIDPRILASLVVNLLCSLFKPRFFITVASKSACTVTDKGQHHIGYTFVLAWDLSWIGCCCSLCLAQLDYGAKTDTCASNRPYYETYNHTIRITWYVSTV